MRQLIFSAIFFNALSSTNIAHGQSTIATLKPRFYSPSSNYSNITEGIEATGTVSSRGDQTPVYNRSVFLLMGVNGRYDGCQPARNSTIYPGGVAIIHRGECTFSTKITRAKEYGAKGRELRENLD
jgi:hypothetical protein